VSLRGIGMCLFPCLLACVKILVTAKLVSYVVKIPE
jgi:hypothetical protein